MYREVSCAAQRPALLLMCSARARAAVRTEGTNKDFEIVELEGLTEVVMLVRDYFPRHIRANDSPRLYHEILPGYGGPSARLLGGAG